MKKLMMFVIVIAVSIIFLNGCDDYNKIDYTIPCLENRFERMYTDEGWYDGEGGRAYYRDRITDVVYFRLLKAMSPLLHEDGTPYLWSEIEGGE